MEIIKYIEFGIETQMISYEKIGKRMKGMSRGKPFVHKDQIRVNIGDELYIVKEYRFMNMQGEEVSRDKVCLDSETRIGGVIVNSRREVLLLEVNDEKHFFCIPGGHRRECETDKECLRREMMEETGIDISGIETTKLLSIHKDGYGPEQFHLINLGDVEIKFKDEDPNSKRTALKVLSLQKAITLDNLYPFEIVEKLKNLSIFNTRYKQVV